MKRTAMAIVAMSLASYAAVAAGAGAGHGVQCSDFRIRDPFVLVENGRYYLYESKPFSGGDGVDVRQSIDLVNWTPKRSVMKLAEDIGPLAVWAPEVHRYDGKFYLFVTITEKDSVRPMKLIGKGGDPRRLKARGTWIFVAESPLGPFEPVKKGPVPPPEFQTLDGTLLVDGGKPYMVYCHEWGQIGNGTVEYAPLATGFSSFLEPPRKLLDARSAMPGAKQITDGVYFYRSPKSGRLYMIWSNFVDGCGYCVLVRSSPSGSLAGPWTKDEILFGENGGHGMIFTGLDKELYLTLHLPNSPPQERMNFFALEDDGRRLRLKPSRLGSR